MGSADCEREWPVLVCILGRFRLLADGQPVPLRPGGKTQTLLSVLALGPAHGVARGDLLGTVWPDSDPSLAAQSLNSLTYHLQRQLGPRLGGASLLLRTGGCYRLNHDAGVAVDALNFAALAAEGDRRAAVGDAAAAVRSYRFAIGLYQGDLDDSIGIQTVVERERLRALYLTLLARLAEHAFAAGDWGAAQEYARLSLACEPCGEEAHRLLMRCFVRRGERAQALRQYRVCEQVLRSEFDAAPEPATRVLFEEVRNDAARVRSVDSALHVVVPGT